MLHGLRSVIEDNAPGDRANTTAQRAAAPTPGSSTTTISAAHSAPGGPPRSAGCDQRAGQVHLGAGRPAPDEAPNSCGDEKHDAKDGEPEQTLDDEPEHSQDQPDDEKKHEQTTHTSTVRAQGQINGVEITTEPGVLCTAGARRAPPYAPSCRRPWRSCRPLRVRWWWPTVSATLAVTGAGAERQDQGELPDT